MQGFILTAITAAEKCTFNLFWQSIGAGNVGQEHKVMLHTWRGCQGQLLCKISYSQLSRLD